LNSSLPIQKILKTSITLILVLAFLFEVPILLCASLGPFVNMLDFQQPKKVMLLST
jgi:Sec-independent protein secretion pathway component TatC